MNSVPDLAPVCTPELGAALERELAAFFGRPVRIVALHRSPSIYQSSFALEDLHIVLEDGSQLALVFKDLSLKSLNDKARRARPDFLYNPLREVEAYRLILAGKLFGTATYYGAFVEPQADRYWLFLERVSGTLVYQIGAFDTWLELARWLARFHDACAGDGELQARLRQTLCYDGAFYRVWLQRACAFLDRAALSASTRRAIARLAGRYDEVIERLLALPYTVIHGEFFASNVLAQEKGARICPVDWEMTALAPGFIDLAALVAGSWTEVERAELIGAYLESITVMSTKPGWPQSAEALLSALDCCRLHLAIQFLGWSNDWAPPPQHAQDWLAEALQLSEKLL